MGTISNSIFHVESNQFIENEGVSEANVRLAVCGNKSVVLSDKVYNTKLYLLRADANVIAFDDPTVNRGRGVQRISTFWL